MKKVSKLVALLASSALLFSGLFLSCGGDDDDNGGGGETTFTQQSVQISLSDLIEEGKDEAEVTADGLTSSDAEVATAALDGNAVKVTSVKKAGNATITVTASNYVDKATIAVSVSADGKPTKGTIKKFSEVKEAAAEATYTYVDGDTTITITTDTEGNFTAKAGEAQVASGTYKKSGTTLVATFAEAVEALGVSADDSLTFTIGEGNVLTLAQTEPGTDPEPNTTVYFTSAKFDEALVNDADTDYVGTVKADYTSADGTWTILGTVDKSTAKVQKSSVKSYNEDETYATRVQIKSAVLKLKVGKGKKVLLRVDGGSASGDGENRTLSSAQSSDSWTSFKDSAGGKVGAGFFEVTGDSDGYVTFSATNGFNIYGIKVVTEKDASLASTELGIPDKTTFYSYGDVAITFDPESAEVNSNSEIKATASVVYSETPLMANGAKGTTKTTTLTTFNFYVDDGTEAVETLPTNEVKTHTVKAVLYTEGTDADGNATKTENTSVSASATYTVLDASKTYVTVTFDKNADDATIGDTTTQKVESGAATALLSAESLGVSYDATHTFNGWNTQSDGNGTSYVDGAGITVSADTTLYAVWKTVTLETIASIKINGVASVANDGGLDAQTGTNLTLTFKGNDSSNPFSLENLTYVSGLAEEFKGNTEKGVKFGKNVLYIEAKLSSGTFRAGDIIYLTGYNVWGVSSDSTKLNAKSSVGTVETGKDKSNADVGSITLPEGTYGDTLYISRGTGSGMTLGNIVVKRAKTE